jgi:hypothetical protein
VKNENEFFIKDLPVLQKGGSFEVARDGGEAAILVCKLSDDDGRLEFDPPTIDPISAHAVHYVESEYKDTVVIESKSAGKISIKSGDKDVIKRFRKGIKHMVRLLHFDVVGGKGPKAGKRTASAVSVTSGGSAAP